MQRLIDDITRLELQRVHPLVRSWLPGARIEENVRAAVDSSMSGGRAGEEAGLLVALPADSVPGALIVHLSGDGHAAGGPGPSQLIDIEHPAVDAPDPASLTSLLRAIGARFPDREGCEIRLYQSSSAGLDLRAWGAPGGAPPAGVVIRPGKRLYALPLKMIRELALPMHYERVSMQPADDLSFYDEYASLYAAMHRERPALASEVPVEPFDKMRVYLEQKTLFHVIIDGERAGVMAALVDRFAGMHGYRILEKFLYPAWRGRGFAPAAQRHFAEALPDTTGEVLYGFIHPDNIWSSRAARHDGREDIGGYFYLRLA